MISGPNVISVVVTRNRLELLKGCIAAIRGQTVASREIIVVNNESTDGTAAWLAEQPDLVVVTQGNLGSSGGQNTGIRLAYEQGAEWIWCMDDDTIADADALGKMLACPKAAEATTGFLASAVRWTDGSMHRMNFPPLLPTYPELFQNLKAGYLRLSSSSFVSLLVARRAVAEAGLPIREMFIWYDDMEFTMRISRKFEGYAVLDSGVLHKTPANHRGDAFGEVTAESLWKFRYGARNKVFCIRKMGMSFLHTSVSLTGIVIKILLSIAFRKSPAITFRILMALLSGLRFNPPVERI
jgi:rhamnopyranosyl-N-acetylglucosaminyl-diphospho-decaprenol beta-1,3/1,4-galactofuranosyltransferase